MTNNFKIQIPNNIVRSSTLNPIEFVLTGKLIQTYYTQPGDNKPFVFEIDHKRMMQYTNIHKNVTFKKHLIGLYEKGIIHNEIDKLPRKGGLLIELNSNLINTEYFTQMEYTVLSQKVIDTIGHTGIRLLYYYESFINRRENKQFCFVSIETIQYELGLSNKTITEYNKKLEKMKFIKIDKHTIDHDYFMTGNGERLLFTKYNNHYYIRQDKINEYCS